MARPKYETPEDCAREAAVAARLASAWNCKLVKCAELYMVDWVKGITASEITGLPFIFVPSFSDKLMWIRPTRYMDVDITMAGSTRRNDPADMEPCYNFKISDLTEVKENV